jgi:cell division protein ZapE
MAEPGAATPPSTHYEGGLQRGEWSDDPVQRQALQALDRIHAALLQPGPSGLFSRLLGSRTQETPQGLYLWGGVGRGKTFLVDLFHAALPLPEVRGDALAGSGQPPAGRGQAGKRRTHFHRFMRSVHAQLREHAGERDPLATIVREWRRRMRVLVLDEFFVNDIGDAMILARLLERMFAEGIVLVTTSNVDPADLYRDGLQRARFLPAIDLIQQHCQVLYMDSDIDYRLRALTRSPVYRAPLDADADRWLETRWRELGGDNAHRDAGIEVDGRRIQVRARCKDMAWFDFAALCEGPRGNTDYIEIAREFHTVLLGGIPVLDGTRDDAARRFVHLVDELYDSQVNLVCTADAPPHALYTGERLTGAFERTASRLIEMQGAEYLATEHRGG